MDSHIPRIINDSSELVSVEQLFVHPENARKGALEEIKESILYHGFYGNIIAEKTSRVILAGNHRYMAAVGLGMTHVPVTWLDLPDIQDQRKILLVDNASNDAATYDNEALITLLTELQATDQGLYGSGYDDGDLQELLGKMEPEVTMEKAEKEPFIVSCPHCNKEFQL